MPTLERNILNWMSEGSRYRLSNFKDFISDRFDSSVDEVEDALRKIEKNGDVYRPRPGLITLLGDAE